MNITAVNISITKPIVIVIVIFPFFNYSSPLVKKSELYTPSYFGSVIFSDFCTYTCTPALANISKYPPGLFNA